MARIDAAIHALETGEPPLRFDNWATPGATIPAAALDLARVAARRAERQLVAMRENGSVVRPLLLHYVNRVSDLLWLLARQAEYPAAAAGLWRRTRVSSMAAGDRSMPIQRRPNFCATANVVPLPQ